MGLSGMNLHIAQKPKITRTTPYEVKKKTKSYDKSKWKVEQHKEQRFKQ